jgi:hypothetical protein
LAAARRNGGKKEGPKIHLVASRQAMAAETKINCFAG